MPAQTPTPWFKATEWWAIIIAVLSLLVSVGVPIYSRMFPPKPKVKILSFLPILTIMEQGDGSFKVVAFKGIAELYNDSDMMVNLREMMITGVTELKHKGININDKSPKVTFRIIGRSIGDNVIKNNSTSLIAYDFANFLDNPSDISGSLYIGSTADEKSWTFVSTNPSVEDIVRVEDRQIVGLNEDFFNGKLNINYLLGESLVPIDKERIMDLTIIPQAGLEN